MLSCQLILDPPGDGAWNMALDEALLESAKSDGLASLRFYSWREPTLSLGYFQTHADRTGHRASAGCRLVRRASGGGAILHDREITYSIALPQSHPAAARADTLYQALHQSLIEVLAEFGVQAAFAEAAPASRATPQPFLCFQRHTAGDVLVGSHKVAGSAQRRHQRAVLQHGSVIIRALGLRRSCREFAILPRIHRGRPTSNAVAESHCNPSRIASSPSGRCTLRLPRQQRKSSRNSSRMPGTFDVEPPVNS